MQLLKNTICILSILQALILPQKTGVLPLVNDSGFEDVWDIRMDIPKFFANALSKDEKIEIISTEELDAILENNKKRKINEYDSEDWKQLLPNGCDVLISGYIDKFDLKRYNVAEPSLAGYEYYTFSLKLRLLFINLKDGTVSEQTEIETDISRNVVGLNLFGRTSSERKDFFGLDKFVFGSDKFMETIVGEGMIDAYNQFYTHYKREIKKVNPLSPAHEIPSLTGKLLTFDLSTGDAFVNIIADKISIGYILYAYETADSLFDESSGQFIGLAEKRTGELKVMEIRNSKLVYAVALGDKSYLKAGQIIKYFRK